MLPGYMDGIQLAGGAPIIFPFSTDEAELKQVAQMCDGFLFTGGHDVSPEVYHKEPLEGLVSCCKKRDAMEEIILRYAVQSGKPVLGICRGIQFINAALGGTLYQDIPTQHPSAVEHHQQPPYHMPSHEVAVMKGSPLHKYLKTENLPVNSCHHQAIKELAPGGDNGCCPGWPCGGRVYAGAPFLMGGSMASRILLSNRNKQSENIQRFCRSDAIGAYKKRPVFTGCSS